jgi:hypothetical protein
MKIIFLSTQLPYSAKAMRTLSLGAFSAEDTKAMLQMWEAPEASQEEIALIQERTKGHPLALRFLIVKSKAEGNYSLLSDDKFAQMSSTKDF